MSSTDKHYYNENDPKAAAWLRQLIAAGHIPYGDVDARSIKEVHAEDLLGYTQWHFFAGIGGWPLALRIADWPVDLPICTGSCPCQPFSTAGKRKGKSDDRHLWPDFHRIIDKLKPPVVVGEQVASKDGLAWLDGVHADMEGSDYSFGAADLCAAGVGQKGHPIVTETADWAYAMADQFDLLGDTECADQLRDFASYISRVIVGPPHIRQRLWWVGISNSWLAHCNSTGRQRECREELKGEPDGFRPFAISPVRDSAAGWFPNASSQPCERNSRRLSAEETGVGGSRKSDGNIPVRLKHGGTASGMGNTIITGLEGHAGDVSDGDQPGWQPAQETGSASKAGGVGGRMVDADCTRRAEGIATTSATGHRSPSVANGFWSDFRIAPCRDGVKRRVGTGIRCLADGIPGRVGLLRGYGNAIVPEVGATFVKTVIEIINEYEPA